MNDLLLLQSKPFLEAKSYWLGQLSESSTVFDIPFIQNNVPGHHDQVKYETVLDQDITSRCLSISGGNLLSLYSLLLASFKICLFKATGQGELVIFSPALPGEIDSPNPVIPIRTQLNTTASFKEIVGQVSESVIQGYKYQYYPISQLGDDIERLIEDVKVCFVLDGMHDTVDYVAKSNELSVDLLIVLRVANSTISCELVGSGRFTEAGIRSLFDKFTLVTQQLLEKTGIPIQNIRLLTTEEEERLIVAHNETQATYPKEQTIHGLFEQQVQRTPDQIAIIDGDRKLTYCELNEKANSFAHVLRGKGVGPDCIVGIIAERSAEMMMGILAILKAGGAYIPIDPGYPQDRIDYMLKDSGAQILLVQESTASYGSDYTGKIVYLAREGETPQRVENVEAEVGPNHLAYVIYTSGSTGLPKGVMIEHTSVVNRLHWMQKQYPIGAGDVLLQKTPISFDVSVWELFWWGFEGATLYLLPPGEEKDPQQIIDGIAKHGVTVIHFVPSMLSAFLSYVKESGQTASCASIRQVFASGEALKLEQVRRFYEEFSYSQARITNLYGPTEATVDVTYYDCTGEEEVVPIGRAIDNIQLYIVDREMQLLPEGLVGELCIGGVGLARGYHDRTELTAEKFANSPFKSGERIYRTGDLARRLPDGNIEYLGRIDDQVKIRGYRIECGEIEQQLLQHEEVESAVVLALQDKEGQSYLSAYVTAREDLSVMELRLHLMQRLPEYMVPAYFNQLESLPLAANGKVNKKALMELETSVVTGVEYKAARNEVESVLIEVWKSVLGHETIGITNDFFELGGDSIKAIQVASKVMEKGYHMDMGDVFLYPTIMELSPNVNPLIDGVEQQNIEGAVPLSPIQRWFFSQNYKHSHHWNQSVMVFKEDGFNEEWVKAIFEKIVQHHDALRMTYVSSNSTVEQKIRALDDGVLFGWKVVSLLDQVEFSEDIRQISEEVQGSFDLEEGPLIKLVLFKTTLGDHLLIVIHHLVTDGISWRILLEDFETGYKQLQNSENITLVEKTQSVKEWVEQLQQYTSTEEFLMEKQYWQAIESSVVEELPFEGSHEASTYSNSKLLVVGLSKEETYQLLNQANKAYGTEINDLLLTALGMAINDWSGQSTIAIHMEGHGREQLGQKLNITRTIGWFTSLYPVVLQINEEMDIAEGILSVRTQLRRIPNKGAGYGVYKYMASGMNQEPAPLELKPEIIFNYLGQFDRDGNNDIFENSSMSAGSNVHQDNEGSYVVEINGIVVQGEIYFDFVYDPIRCSEESMVTLTSRFIESLRSIIVHCVSKVKEGTE